MRVKKLKTV